MALTVIALLVVAGIAFRVMTGEERGRAGRTLLAVIQELKHAARHRRAEDQSFRDALKGRTRWALVTPALIILNVTIVLFMIVGVSASGGSWALSDPKTLVDWGASIGPRTTNGEWWRLGTSMFVHSGVVQVLVCAAGLLQVGLILERLVGRLTFAAVYLAAGSFASLVNLSAHPATAGFGASGAIFGLYGLLLAYTMWDVFHRSTVTIPLVAMKRLLPAAGVFILYSVMNDSLDASAEVTGFATGFVCGLVLMMGASDPRPAARRIGAVIATVIVIAAVSTIPLRGFADVWPELERIVAVEDRTARDYQTADRRFNQRRITADALADLIDQQITPELQAATARLKAIRKVPKEHQPLVADAGEYLRLRSESWRLRAYGLRQIELRDLQPAGETDQPGDASQRLRAEARHRTNLSTMGNAEGKARASLELLHRIETRLHRRTT